VSRYLLPCRCGHEFVIEPRLAGETLSCACGATLQVPTMLEMQSLELAPPERAAAPARSSWGLRQQLFLMGGLLIVITAVAAIWLYRTRPIAPSDVMNPEYIREIAKRFPPTQTWAVWESMKQGIRPPDPRYAAALTRYHAWLGVTGILALLGIAMVASGAMTGRATTKR
jgi:hypothetical protein